MSKSLWSMALIIAATAGCGGPPKMGADDAESVVLQVGRFG
jgi:hypothetical protein